MKRDYSKAYKKKIVQRIVFDEFKKRKMDRLVGLAGPNISDYLSFVKSKGIKRAEIYERDYLHLIFQMQNFRAPIKTTVLYQDVLDAEIHPNTIYDLDFCCTIKSVAPHIKKFRSNAIVTLALRGIGLMYTLRRFSRLITKEKPEFQLNVEVNSDYKMHILHIGGCKYAAYQYFDTTPMLLISPKF